MLADADDVAEATVAATVPSHQGTQQHIHGCRGAHVPVVTVRV